MKKSSDQFIGKIGDRVHIEFEGIITSLPDEDGRFTMKSEDGFSQYPNLDYPGVSIVNLTEREKS